MHFEDDIEWDDICAQLPSEFTGADIKALIDTAQLIAIKEYINKNTNNMDIDIKNINKRITADIKGRTSENDQDFVVEKIPEAFQPITTEQHVNTNANKMDIDLKNICQTSDIDVREKTKQNDQDSVVENICKLDNNNNFEFEAYPQKVSENSFYTNKQKQTRLKCTHSHIVEALKQASPSLKIHDLFNYYKVYSQFVSKVDLEIMKKHAKQTFGDVADFAANNVEMSQRVALK